MMTTPSEIRAHNEDVLDDAISTLVFAFEVGTIEQVDVADRLLDVVVTDCERAIEAHMEAGRAEEAGWFSSALSKLQRERERIYQRFANEGAAGRIH